jgi:hypothetical protein
MDRQTFLVQAALIVQLAISIVLTAQGQLTPVELQIACSTIIVMERTMAHKGPHA